MQGELLSHGVDYARSNFKQYLKGFDETNCLAQAPGLPNHLAWTLGHLALVIHRAAEKLDSSALPAGDFVANASSDRRCFDTETICYGSTPTADAATYPSYQRSLAIFDAAVDRLCAGLRAANDAKLDEPIQWGKRQMPIRDLSVRMIFHLGLHAGEIADLRRALKLGSIFS